MYSLYHSMHDFNCSLTLYRPTLAHFQCTAFCAELCGWWLGFLTQRTSNLLHSADTCMWVVARIPHFYFTHIPFRPTYLTSNLLLSVPIYVGGGGGLGLLTLAKYVGGMCPVLVQKISVKCIWTQTFNVEAILTVTPWCDNTSFP